MMRHILIRGFFSPVCPKNDCTFVVTLKLNKTDNGRSRRRGISPITKGNYERKCKNV